MRVKVEHAIAAIKYSRWVKDVLRNTKDGFFYLVMVTLVVYITCAGQPHNEAAETMASALFPIKSNVLTILIIILDPVCKIRKWVLLELP